MAVGADGGLVASGGFDATVRLWDVTNGRARATLRGHTGGVWGVALSGDAQVVASAGEDGTVRLWDAKSGHTGGIWCLALSDDGGLAASASFDGTIRLWDTTSGSVQRMLRGEPRYERTDITGLTGITDAQRVALLALGAVEQRGPAGEPSATMPLGSAL